LKILADLKALGYSVTLDGENIRQRFCVGSDALHIIPNTLCVEPTKLTQACSLVTGVASVTGTNETHETNAEEDLIL